MDRRKFKSCKNTVATVSKVVLLPLAICAFLGGCKTTAKETVEVQQVPSWFTSPPTSSYLVYGVGVASQQSDIQQLKLSAQESARLAIAKQLNVEIEASTTVLQNKDNNVFSYNVDEILYSKVPKIKLQGVKIEEEYISQDQKHAYALASFNRTEALMHTELEINNLDEQLSKYELNANSKSALLHQAMQAKTLLAKRSRLNEYHKQLGGGSLALPNKVLAKNREIGDFLASLTFNIETTHWDQESIRHQLAQSLSRQGLSIVSTEDADFKLSFEVNMDKVSKEGTHYIFADSSLTVLEKNQEKLHLSAQIKAASSYENIAHKNAVEKTAKALSDKLTLAIINNRI
ncbi:hypothetical protein ACSLBF_06780 [Pseudoalteromonas sp. T1lg65]|uniref:hypothetical protein n=1 Tax=Pseudoalteromonas sp. T1lg65 TaxID=2077101 RepID=UPI003F794E77